MASLFVTLTIIAFVTYCTAMAIRHERNRREHDVQRLEMRLGELEKLLLAKSAKRDSEVEGSETASVRVTEVDGNAHESNVDLTNSSDMGTSGAVTSSAGGIGGSSVEFVRSDHVDAPTPPDSRGE